MNSTQESVLCYAIILITSCYGVKICLELKPVTIITQVLSREIEHLMPMKFDELYEQNRVRICQKAAEMIGHNIEPLGIGRVTSLQEYVVEVRKNGRRASLEIIEAFQCPWTPTTLIRTDTWHTDKRDNLKLSVIFKDTAHDNPIDLGDIMSYHILQTRDITEAYSDELRSWGTEFLVQKISFFDTDALSERQCLQMCRKAFYVVLDQDVLLQEGVLTSCGKNKYYSLGSRDLSGAENRGILRAYKCPTQPQIYVHVDEDMDTWFIVEENELRPEFNVVGYELKPVVEIIRVPEYIQRMMFSWNPNIMERAVSNLNFNVLPSAIRLKICVKTIKVLFGTRLRVIQNTEIIGKSEFYNLKSAPDGLKPNILQAVICPTDSSVIGPAYLHVTGRHSPEENMVQLYVKSTDALTRLSAWTDEQNE